jgi:hypothetical protein
MSRKYFCPLYRDIRLSPCPSKPTKAVLFEKLSAIADEKEYLLGFSMENLPVKRWMIMVLSTLNPKDEIFAKNYVAPPVHKKKGEEKVIEVPKNLFEGLPMKAQGKR